MSDADENTRLSRRAPETNEQPEDSTQLVSRRDRRNAAAGTTDDTVIVSRPAPPATSPADETVIVDRRAAPPAAVDEPDDRTQLVQRPVSAAADDPDDGTLLVRRPAAEAGAETTTAAPPAAPRPEPLDDEHTVLTPRGAGPAPRDTDDTVLRPRDEPADETLLRRRERPAEADTDADADDTVLRRRDGVDDDATSLADRGSNPAAAPRLTRARRGAAQETASFAPDAATDRTPARERYAIRTRTIDAAPTAAAAAPVVDVGDGGLAARIARRRATRTRLAVLAGVSSVVFVGAIVGLATLLSM